MVISGQTGGDWEVTNAGGPDFVAIKFDADGEELWRWQVCLCAGDAFAFIYERWSVDLSTLRFHDL